MAHTIHGKEKLILRIRRIRGQLNAAEKALQDEKDCSELLHTLSACRGAMGSLIAEILEGHVFEHVVVSDHGKHKKPAKDQLDAAHELMSVIRTYLR